MGAWRPRTPDIPPKRHAKPGGTEDRDVDTSEAISSVGKMRAPPEETKKKKRSVTREIEYRSDK